MTPRLRGVATWGRKRVEAPPFVRQRLPLIYIYICERETHARSGWDLFYTGCRYLSRERERVGEISLSLSLSLSESVAPQSIRDDKTTLNDGYLGLVIDEGRSEVR